MLSNLIGIRPIKATGMGLKKMKKAEDPIRKKVVLVGDGFCGKTCLQVAFRRDVFDPLYQVTVFENFVVDFVLDGIEYELAIWDTAGQEDYEQLRPLSYPDTDVIVLCFAIDCQDSFENLKSKWLPELQYYCPQVPIVLVGNKIDLRSDAETLSNLHKLGHQCVTPEKGSAMAEELGARDYVECSAKMMRGVQDVFDTVVKVAATYPTQGPKMKFFNRILSCWKP
ncbi:hypothetical protein TCAL_11728 [Tigriopus californicus]|uniref:Ras-like GTP-binding protein Rho1 n=1 Tax=Tigriopus californicus TaxID=6832 RepID=A0A553NFX6_TIGCA|nr:ras-like GTP-binding protein RHO [Tigriopus californicus]XP_059094545.1 ras-like GTP-binding protein RHO [Tigriopus californicus]TRY64362.1 hypothetical protein TCAL_11728 [Tigriopus californicus]|eukprot:TCALIF_11728-PA protein Name:"Similar to Rho1 Ras-like GTP-binding protein Rho1 (Drosophila melanogaster)" AED:0.12 eAED:0.12 QI:0/0/0/1/1/1/2/0/224